MRQLVIQEHNAEKAGLHWDVRFEEWKDNTPFLRSFVIPKHRFPIENERLLAISVDDHAWSYKSFEGVINIGYGKGTVKLLYNDPVEVDHYDEKKIIFDYKDNKYKIYQASWMKEKNNYLIKKL